MNAPAAHRGFTLMEMLVVLVLMSVAVGLLGFALHQGLSSAGERRAVGDMVEALRATRVKAIVTGQPSRTEFDLRRLTVKAPGKRTQHLPEHLRITLNTAADLGASVEFYPDGGSSGGNLTVQGASKRWRIDIAWLTGNVQVRTL
ncbi:pilus assembly FimT family protein [Pseudomonas sp. JDS28PS106]|uniref:pilus assembly FimT family protein n=1 Tax=Pseudomonas sp. JDS28PS106 TaxID=2497235 RepID=UPI003FA7D104